MELLLKCGHSTFSTVDLQDETGRKVQDFFSNFGAFGEEKAGTLYPGE